MKKYLIVDIETDSLKPEIIWVIATKDFHTGEKRVFTRPDLNPQEFTSYQSSFDFIVGHNFIWFDNPALLRLVSGYRRSPEQVVDTLVVSRLINHWDYEKHGLEEWGNRLGIAKPEYTDWSGGLTDAMIHRCQEDVEITEAVFKFFQRYIEDPKLGRAMSIEHRAAIICREMHDNGFGFDIGNARALFSVIEAELKVLSEEISKSFPPKRVLVRSILPTPTKSGSINRKDFRWITDGRTPEEHGYRVGVPVNIYDTVEFNPASPKQCVERLNEFGWKPTEKTKGHLKCERDLKWARRPDEREALLERLEEYQKTGWTISEENLETLPPDAPEAAKSLVRHILLTRRLTVLTEWINAYNERTKCIHGEVRSIGTWTHRASHKNPNTGNIARVSSEFGGEMRALWQAGAGFRQIGCDAEGIQLRILAHYMDDNEFTTALVSGSSEDGSDVHTLNWKKLGHVCKDRTTAKTFIYSYLLGAGVAKTAQIFQCSEAEAREAREKFTNSFPGLRHLKEVLIPEDAERGYFIGIDGRPVMCDSTHLMLAGYLQNGESVVMKHANWKWRNDLKSYNVFQMNYVHDEWQSRVRDGLPEDVYIHIAETMADSIRWAGEDLGVKCPLAGSYKIGYNWKDCH